MGITLDDLNAQRAMLKRGEEKRKADWQQAERERLRDTFAAAALTGMMSRVAGKAESFAEAAYKLADAMLRERGNHSAKPNSSPTLTDEEREAIEAATTFCECTSKPLPRSEQIATLRKLLER